MYPATAKGTTLTVKELEDVLLPQNLSPQYLSSPVSTASGFGYSPPTHYPLNSLKPVRAWSSFLEEEKQEKTNHGEMLRRFMQNNGL